MPTYYDEEEDDSGAGYPDSRIEDYGTPFYDQAQAAERDSVLSQALPSALPVSSGPIGQATKEYLSGRPGLFIQGGSSVPAGMIQVNGELERSQAAPQPVPWWIKAADDFKEQRRQEDFLTTLIDRAGPAGAQAVQRAQQLQARMQLDADIKGGMPFRDALMKNAANLYANAPAAMTRLATSRPVVAKTPFAPTQTVLGGKTYTQVSPNRFVREQESEKGLTKAQELSYLSQQSKIMAKQLEDATTAGDKAGMASATAELQSLKEQADVLRGRKQGALTQTQTSPRVALANRLASEHPDWTKEQIVAEVKKQSK